MLQSALHLAVDRVRQPYSSRVVTVVHVFGYAAMLATAAAVAATVYVCACVCVLLQVLTQPLLLS